MFCFGLDLLFYLLLSFRALSAELQDPLRILNCAFHNVLGAMKYYSENTDSVFSFHKGHSTVFWFALADNYIVIQITSVTRKSGKQRSLQKPFKEATLVHSACVMFKHWQKD